MTLSGDTSTLPLLVVWGAGFQGHLLDPAKTQFCPPTGTHFNRGRDLIWSGFEGRKGGWHGQDGREVDCQTTDPLLIVVCHNNNNDIVPIWERGWAGLHAYPVTRARAVRRAPARAYTQGAAKP